MQQNVTVSGLCPGPHWGPYSTPRAPLTGFKGERFAAGREGKEEEGRGRERQGGRGRGSEGGEEEVETGPPIG